MKKIDKCAVRHSEEGGDGSSIVVTLHCKHVYDSTSALIGWCTLNYIDDIKLFE